MHWSFTCQFLYVPKKGQRMLQNIQTPWLGFMIIIFSLQHVCRLYHLYYLEFFNFDLHTSTRTIIASNY